MAKIGYLYLNKGKWEDKQIISQSWVEESTKEHVAANTLAPGYGYQWWINNNGFYSANGYGGQQIFIVPQLNLVVVFIADLPANNFPIPENTEGEQSLKEIIGDLGNPEPVLPTPLPEMAYKISGKT